MKACADIIRFGTDGWRARIAEDYTFDNVRRVAQAVADYLNSHYSLCPGSAKPGAKKVIVGYDRRFLSGTYARLCCEVLAANDIKVLLTKNAVPTPAVTFSIKKNGLDGGIIITASHNPAVFNGIKFKTCLAASADEDTTKKLEALAGQCSVKRADFESALKDRKIQLIDAGADYVDFLKRYVDIKSIRRAKPRLLVDYMHGTGAGYIEAVLGRDYKNITAIRDGNDPLFGGVNPEPIPKNLKACFDVIAQKRFDIAVALDGDADRIGAVRPDGRYITSGQIVSLILLHFLEDRNLRGSVVKTISGTTLIEKICGKFGLTLFETPVGFKYISALMMKENVLIGGEESGGIGFCGYIPERDGILSALLLLELIAQRRKPIISVMDTIDRHYGKFCYNRIDVPYPLEKARELNNKLKDSPPAAVAGKKVVKMKTYDGIKFIMEDESWLLLRFSGTEPLIRIYAEASSDKRVKDLLSEGKAMIGA